MKIQFDTEKEAQEALRHSRNTGLGFCPLIKRECRVDCVSYYEGNIHKPHAGTTKWIIHYSCCNNVLISGIIAVES